MTKKIGVLTGDGIGPEIVAEALKVLGFLNEQMSQELVFEKALIGDAAYDARGTLFPRETIGLVKNSEAILLEVVGGPKWDMQLLQHYTMGGFNEQAL